MELSSSLFLCAGIGRQLMARIRVNHGPVAGMMQTKLDAVHRVKLTQKAEKPDLKLGQSDPRAGSN